MTAPSAAPSDPPKLHYWWVWGRLALGAVAVGVALWVWLTRTAVLLTGHPAYPILVTVVGITGLTLIALAVTGRHRPRRSSRRRWWRASGRVASAVVLAALVAMTAWLRPFPATPEAAALAEGNATVVVTSNATTFTLTPGVAPSGAGLVFQPGARVDPRAYLPLLTRIAERGHLVVIVKQPLTVGLLAINAPADVISAYPEVTTWVVGGHSLGGVAAGQYAAGSPSAVRGLLLWASYPLDSLAGRDQLAVTSISGTADGFTTTADVEASRAKLPSTATFVAIDGGIHSFFGDYGLQPGDGTPTTARARAQDEIVTATLVLLDRVGPSRAGSGSSG